jgi:GntR family transcriptional regulator, transcriptional repressor for pyruvate dehydrogenase complex
MPSSMLPARGPAGEGVVHFGHQSRTVTNMVQKSRTPIRRSLREKPQQVADEIRHLIVSGELDEGESIGREPELIERFGVSRPSLREALRILEAEGLISVIRGVQGGVVAHRPDSRLAARTAAIVLQARNVSLADVSAARTIIEPAAVRLVASARNRKACARELRGLIAAEEEVIGDPVAFGPANARFHKELVAMAGNQTLTIVAEMLSEVVARAVTAVSQIEIDVASTSTRRRGVRSQLRLAELIEAGKADEAEQHWRAHMDVVGRVMLGQRARTVVDLMDHI